MIEEKLEAIHRSIGAASFGICMALVKRQVKRQVLVDALEKIKFVAIELERLIAGIDEKRNSGSSNSLNSTGE